MAMGENASRAMDAGGRDPGFVGAGLLAWLVSWLFDLPRGDLPSWLGAVGTVGVLLLAVWVYNRDQAARLLLEQQRFEEQLRAQAKLVDAWLVDVSGAPMDQIAALRSTGVLSGNRQLIMVHVEISNRSEQPSA